MLQLRFPHKNDPNADRKTYDVHASFAIQLGPGMLFILDPLDDVYMTHEAHFEACVKPLGVGAVLESG